MLRLNELNGRERVWKEMRERERERESERERERGKVLAPRSEYTGPILKTESQRIIIVL